MTPIYGAAIKVIAGFYLGCTGYVLAPAHEYHPGRYVVDLTCKYKLKNTFITDGFKVTLDKKDFEITNIPR